MFSSCFPHSIKASYKASDSLNIKPVSPSEGVEDPGLGKVLFFVPFVGGQLNVCETDPSLFERLIVLTYMPNHIEAKRSCKNVCKKTMKRTFKCLNLAIMHISDDAVNLMRSIP